MSHTREYHDKTENPTNVDYVAIFGGLGNQIFQYNFGLYLEEHFSKKIQFLDCGRQFKLNRHWQLHTIGITPTRTSFKQNFSFGARRNLYKLEKLTNIPLNSRIITDSSFKIATRTNINSTLYFGYWQNLDYVKPNYNKLNKIFKDSQPLYDRYIQQINTDPYSVAIHIRRGDYIEDKKTRLIHQVCDYGYYERGVQFMRERIKRPNFYVFSDDIKYVQEKFKFLSDANFIVNETGVKPDLDLRRMLECKHFIISNSTYSLWPALLSNSTCDKLVVAPSQWFRGVNTLSINLVPDNWCILPIS